MGSWRRGEGPHERLQAGQPPLPSITAERRRHPEQPAGDAASPPRLVWARDAASPPRLVWARDAASPPRLVWARDAASPPRLVWARDKGGLKGRVNVGPQLIPAPSEPLAKAQAVERRPGRRVRLPAWHTGPRTQLPSPPASWAVWPAHPARPAGLWQAAGRGARLGAVTGWPWGCLRPLITQDTSCRCAPALLRSLR